MGKALYEACPEAREPFDVAAQVCERPIADICFNGPEDTLKETANTQVCLFTVEAAISRVLHARGIAGSLCAGHSLGEYSALYHSGALPFEDGLRLVSRRAALMDEATRRRPGAMAAVIGLAPARIEDVLAHVSSGIVVAANQNSPQQTVISGETAAVDDACAMLKEAGASRCKKLRVSGAFHSPLMQEAADAFGPAISNTHFAAPRVPVVANTRGEALDDPAAIAQALVDQITSPVRWVETVQTFGRTGITLCIEAGPGSVLTGLVRKTDASLELVSAHTPEDIDALAGLVQTN
jgi:[acyl-carrier-protein] S-malonyltransferase